MWRGARVDLAVRWRALDRKGMRILLVEDDAVIASSLSKGLRGEAYAVDVATDGDAAVYQAASNPYDAIVLDVMLPKRDGFAVCREFRGRGLTWTAERA